MLSQLFDTVDQVSAYVMVIIPASKRPNEVSVDEYAWPIIREIVGYSREWVHFKGGADADQNLGLKKNKPSLRKVLFIDCSNLGC